jgi:hypothetical protein
MTRLWGLACLDCLVGLELGRLVEIQDDGLPLEPYFQGFRISALDRWIGGEALRRYVELFQIGHLGHELGLVDADEVLRWFEDVPADDWPFRWLNDSLSQLNGVYLSESTASATGRLARHLGISQ